MKRTRPWSYENKPFKKPRPSQPVVAMPVTTYKSLAPLATRGYRPNKKEWKVYDLGNGGTGIINTGNISVAGTVINLFLPVQGADMNQRIGRKTCIRTIDVRGNIFCELGNSLQPGNTKAGCVKVMLLWDTQPGGAVATPGEIWNVGGTPHSGINMNNRDRFKVIRTKTMSFDPMLISTTATQSYAAWGHTNEDFHFYVKNLSLETVFSTSAGTIADIATGSLLIAFIADTSTGLNSDFNTNFVSRVRYSDD